MNFLIYPPLTPDELEQVQAVSPDLEIVNALTEEDALAAIPQAVGMYGDLTPALLERAESLCWLQTPIAGLEHYMFPELAESDVVVSNMAKIYSDMIADHAFCFILMFARGIHLYMRRQIRGEWRKGTPVRHLGDCTLGVIGLGGIGSELARRGKAHDMRVIAVDARPNAAPVQDLDLDALWPQERLHDLMAEADFAVSCVPQTPETVGMITGAHLASMKEGAAFINTARGAVVNEPEMIAVLQQRYGPAAVWAPAGSRIAGATVPAAGSVAAVGDIVVTVEAGGERLEVRVNVAAGGG